MSQKYCYQIGEWIEDNVSQQVEKCVEQDCDWWCLCCNKWLCSLVWVIVTVAKWVVQTVCEILGDVFDLVVAIIKGGWDIIAGIFTGDWSRVWDGFMEILGAIGGVLGDLIRAITFCGLVGGFRESINKWRLRGYAESLIDKSERFSDTDRAQIKAALGINGGGFGLRLTVTSYRGFVRSDFIKPGDTVPALVRWNNDPDPNTQVDLKILAGFKWTSFSEMGRPDVRGDNGNISESDIDEYLANPGSKSFSIYALSDSELLDRIHNVQIKGDTIGLKLVIDLKDQLFTEPTQVRAIPTARGVIDNLAKDPFNRPPFDGSTDKSSAASVLCTPVIVGTFLFHENHFTGYSACLYPCTCLDGTAFGNDGGTGAEYRQRIPNWVSTWAPIHELGHTFGLCHVDGFDRIMVSPMIIACGAGGFCRSTSALAANHNSCMTRPRRYGTTSSRTFQRTALLTGRSSWSNDDDWRSRAARIFGMPARPRGRSVEAKAGTSADRLRVPSWCSGDAGWHGNLDRLFDPGARGGAVLAAHDR